LECPFPAWTSPSTSFSLSHAPARRSFRLVAHFLSCPSLPGRVFLFYPLASVSSNPGSISPSGLLFSPREFLFLVRPFHPLPVGLPLNLFSCYVFDAAPPAPFSFPTYFEDGSSPPSSFPSGYSLLFRLPKVDRTDFIARDYTDSPPLRFFGARPGGCCLVLSDSFNLLSGHCSTFPPLEYCGAAGQVGSPLYFTFTGTFEATLALFERCPPLLQDGLVRRLLVS